MTEGVHVERDGGVVTLTIDNPPLNIVTAGVRTRLASVLTELRQDDALRCVVLTGAGDRSFCAGADLGEEAELTPATVRKFLEDDGEIFDSLEQLPVPVVAAVNGHCMGGGLELALSCDVRVVAEDAKLCGAGVKVGLVVSTTRLTRLVGPAAAKDVLLTGRTFSGADAFRLGVAAAAVPRADVVAEARSWARQIATRAPLAVRRTKTAIHEAAELPFTEAIGREFDHFAALSATEDHKHAIEAFFARETPAFQGR